MLNTARAPSILSSQGKRASLHFCPGRMAELFEIKALSEIARCVDTENIGSYTARAFEKSC